MEASSKPNRIHPLVAGAAVSVMLVSLTGVAAITGILPTSHSSRAPETSPTVEPVAAAPAISTPVAAVAPAETKTTTKPESKAEVPPPKPKPIVKQEPRPQPVRTAQPAATYVPPPVAQAPAACYTCGRVEYVQVIEQQAQPSGVGMVAGALLGGALGNQVGDGNGRKLATVAGAIGGGYAGNRIEQNTRAASSYQVHVRMEGGEMRSFPYAQRPGWSSGDRVRVVDGQLTARN